PGIVRDDTAHLGDVCQCETRVLTHSLSLSLIARSGLAFRAPVELPRTELLEHDLRAARPAWQTGTAPDPVTVITTRPRCAVVVGREVVHRHHLTGLDADRQKPGPVVPELPDDLHRYRFSGCVRVQPRPIEHLRAVDIADSADDGLIHQQ